MRNPKNDLIEYCRAMRMRNPKFETRNIGGSDHEPLFMTEVTMDGDLKGSGQGNSKRDSERVAAEEAYGNLTTQYGQAPTRERRPNPNAASGNTAQNKGNGGTSDSSNEAWPIYAEVLVKALEVANSRVDTNRRGPEAVDLVRKLTLDLYKGILEDLGSTLESSRSMSEETASDA
jgi:ribonuclease III